MSFDPMCDPENVTGKYILDGHEPVPCPDLVKWALWFEASEMERQVALTFMWPGIAISTVFLGLNQRFLGDGAPLLFETKVFHGEPDVAGGRCTTWVDAEQMHAQFVAAAGTFKWRLRAAAAWLKAKAEGRLPRWRIWA